MPATIYVSGTVYLANEVTMVRGTPADVLEVLVYHDTDANVVPTYAEMTEVQWITTGPLQEDSKNDVLSKMGPGVAALVDPGEVDLQTPGDYQRWVGIRTADEFVPVPIDTVTVVG